MAPFLWQASATTLLSPSPQKVLGADEGSRPVTTTISTTNSRKKGDGSPSLCYGRSESAAGDRLKYRATVASLELGGQRVPDG